MSRQRPDYYLILGVTSTATPQEVARAYRALIRRHHPDSRPPEGDQTNLADIHEAYAVLRDPRRRADYDRSRARPQASPGVPVRVRVRQTQPPPGPSQPGATARGQNGPLIRIRPTVTVSSPRRSGPELPLLRLLDELRRR
ncbi:J domain-containing protein [Ruania albidiflava]|uniref:J domain-containing protein n=1 Tax=Ruania albidiflava TaxID=366586 RepID=UPI0009FE1134